MYFNTFYNAESSFYKAEKYIDEESSLSSEISSKAEKLLDKTVKNCLIVIEKYPDSKWVDDAFFLLARSKFLKGEIISAKEKFSELIEKFPSSEYVDEANLWILFSDIHLLKFDDFDERINEVKRKQLSNSNRFLLNKINAEYFKKNNNLDSCYFYYLNALNYSDNHSQKISVYSNLALISSDNKDYARSIDFIDILEDLSKNNDRVELGIRKIEFYKKLNKFDQLILEIPMMLDSEEFKSKKLYLELELAKAYMNKGDFSQAKEYFVEITDNNQKKDETAESFYWLGMMSIKENFDLILADDYFEKSKVDKSSSRYGRESKDILTMLSKYDKLVEMYSNSLKSIKGSDSLNIELNENMTIHSYNSADSIYMMMIDMMNFDFGRIDKAVDEYKKFVKIYNHSKYLAQVYYILSIHDSSNWQLKIDKEFPNSKYSTFSRKEKNDDKLKSIDKAWSLVSENSQLAFKKFINIANTYRDTSSFYLAAFIADKYMNNLDSALVYYTMFVDSFPNHSYSTASKFRINQIKDLLIEKVEFTDNLLLYNEAVNILVDSNDEDSSKVLFAALSNRPRGESYDFSRSAKKMKDKISYYQSLTESIYKIDTLDTQDVSTIKSWSTLDDSLHYYRSNIFETIFGRLDSADYYYSFIVENFKESKYYNKSLLGLYRINRQKEILDKINSGIEFDINDTIISDNYFLEDFILSQSDLKERRKYLSTIKRFINLIPPDSLLFSDSNSTELNSQLKSSDIPDIQKIKNMSNIKIDLNIPE